MAMKNENHNIRCKVKSCEFHCDSDFCTLNCIQVEPCTCGCTGKAADESMCASYQSK